MTLAFPGLNVKVSGQGQTSKVKVRCRNMVVETSIFDGSLLFIHVAYDSESSCEISCEFLLVLVLVLVLWFC